MIEVHEVLFVMEHQTPTPTCKGDKLPERSDINTMETIH